LITGLNPVSIYKIMEVNNMVTKQKKISISYLARYQYALIDALNSNESKYFWGA